MSINSLLNVSRDSLLSYQLAIDLTGANIANVSTPGYSRQRAVFETQGKVNVNAISAQVGVGVTEVQRIYDAYLNNQVTNQAQVVEYYETKDDLLNRIEGIFMEAEGGTNDLLSKFWNAWSELAASPRNQVVRENLQAAAENLTADFRSKADDLDAVVKDANDDIANIVSEINNYLSEIASLNTTIVSLGTQDKGDGNILRDERFNLLNELGGLIGFQYVEDASGATNVFLASGKPLVAGDDIWRLAVTGSETDVVYESDTSDSLAETIQQGKKGKLAALLEIRETTIPAYEEKLDALVDTLITEVNTRHAQGYDAEGNAGEDFFAAATGAGDFYVSAAIRADVQKIAASATVNGDGANALAMASIKDKLTMNGATATMADNYAALIGRIGRDVADVKNDTEQQSTIMEQLSSRREATSGVSLDEEMMNLIKYQMAYGAAGKMINTVNELMDTLMQISQ